MFEGLLPVQIAVYGGDQGSTRTAPLRLPQQKRIEKRLVLAPVRETGKAEQADAKQRDR